MQAAAAFQFRNRNGFTVNLGSICTGRASNSGRNLMFSFDSAMSPPDPGYQTALQYIHQVQYASSIYVGGLEGAMDCEHVDLDLHGVAMAECPAGRYFDG